MIYDRPDPGPVQPTAEVDPAPFFDLPDGPVYDLESDKDRRIVEWRRICLKAMGFEPLYVEGLALRRDVDLRELERLIDAGATPEQARDIIL